jgi:hypothetical protein
MTRHEARSIRAEQRDESFVVTGFTAEDASDFSVFKLNGQRRQVTFR